MAASGPIGSPEYVALFDNGAEVVSGLVKEMFHNDDPRLVPLMASFPWTNLTPVLADRLWWSDFPLALLELVSDRKWYDLLKDGLKRDVQHWDNVVPVAWRFTLVIECLTLFRSKLHLCLREEKVRRFTERLPALWKLLWENKDTIFSEIFAKLARGVNAKVAELLAGYFTLFARLHSTNSRIVIPPLTVYAAHLGFYFWIYPPKELDERFRFDGRYILDMLQQGHASTGDRNADAAMREQNTVIFCREIIPAIKGGVAEVIRRVMVRGTPMDSTRYRDTLEVMSLLIAHGGEQETTSWIERMMHVWAAAAQRYECYGYTQVREGQRTSDPGEIAFHFLAAHGGFFAGSSQRPTDPRGLTNAITESIESNTYRYNYVHMVAQSLVYVCQCLPHGKTQLNIVYMYLHAYEAISRKGKARLVKDQTHRRNYLYLRRVLQVHWHPALTKLRSALLQTEVHRQDEEVRAALRSLLKRWEDIGRDFNLSFISRDDDMGLTDYVTEKEKFVGCFSAECPCFGQKPLHGVRKICKGCWSAFYCGPRCQTKDWMAGHKYVCGRSRVKC